MVNFRLKSLSEICQNSLTKNASSITWLGIIPFKLIENVLKKVSPKQESDALWKNHCLNEFADVKRQYLDGSLSDPESWRELFNVKKREEDQKTMRLSKKLQSMKQEHDIQKNSRNAKLLDQSALSKLTKKGTSTPPMAKRKIGMLYQQTLKEVGKRSIFGGSSSKTPPQRSEAANLFLGSGKKQRKK